MEFIGVFFAFLYAVILTAIFSLIYKNTGPWSGYWIFFFILFLTAWVAGDWVTPAGPAIWGYYWVPGLFAALVIALVIAAATPVNRSSARLNKSGNSGKVKISEERKDDEEETVAIVTAVSIGLFFWIAIILLAVVAVIGIIAD